MIVGSDSSSCPLTATGNGETGSAMRAEGFPKEPACSGNSGWLVSDSSRIVDTGISAARGL